MSKFNLSKIKTILTGEVVVHENEFDNLKVNLKDDFGNNLENEEIVLETIHDMGTRSYFQKTDKMGIINVPITFQFSYKLVISYNGSEKYEPSFLSIIAKINDDLNGFEFFNSNTISSKIGTVINAEDLFKDVNNEDSFKVNLKNQWNDNLKNKSVIISVLYPGGYTDYSFKTNNEGIVKLPICLNSGTYKVVSRFIGDDMYEPSIKENIITVTGTRSEEGELEFKNASINYKNLKKGKISADEWEDLEKEDEFNKSLKIYNEIAVDAKNISMEFDLSFEKIDNLKEYVIKWLKREIKPKTTFKALQDVSFNIKKGERVGIIGFNGAGKSTLLKILSGVLKPTTGELVSNGRIAPLLELGAGFDHNYSGGENIFLNGAILGYPKSFLEEKYDEIVDFSELEEFIDVPIKNYSSGMKAKLGFSIATIVEPDILILDEVLSVGDVKFQEKSGDKIKELMGSGVTVLLVSHSTSTIKKLCSRAIWLDHGKIIMDGDVDEVCEEYIKASEVASPEEIAALDFTHNV